VASLVRFAEEEPLYQYTAKTYDKRTNEKAQPEVAEICRDAVSDISAQHIKRGMGEVQNTHHAENEREPRCYEKKKHTVYETMHGLR
jgi:hypothetical protein